MKKSTIIGICLLLVSMAIVSSGSFIVGTFEKKDVSNALIDRIDTMVIERNITIDEFVGTDFIERQEEEYRRELFNEIESKIYSTDDVTRLKEILDYLNNGCGEIISK